MLVFFCQRANTRNVDLISERKMRRTLLIALSGASSKHHWKIGNPSSRENVVMTSSYECPSQTLGEGVEEGRLNVNAISAVLN